MVGKIIDTQPTVEPTPIHRVTREEPYEMPPYEVQGLRPSNKKIKK